MQAFLDLMTAQGTAKVLNVATIRRVLSDFTHRAAAGASKARVGSSTILFVLRPGTMDHPWFERIVMC